MSREDAAFVQAVTPWLRLAGPSPVLEDFDGDDTADVVELRHLQDHRAHVRLALMNRRAAVKVWS